MTDLEGAILVGGHSRRMGRDKATLELGGRRIVDRIADELREVVRCVRVVGGPERVLAGSFAHAEDRFPGCGPLGGLHAALATAETSAVIVVGCDMPFVTASFLRGLVAGLSDDFDAVVPRESGRSVAVCAVYRKTCLSPLEERLERRELAARDFVGSIRTRWVEGDVLERLDPTGLCLKNINSPEDFEEAVRIVADE